MAHELRQLVDTANAPIFGIGKYCTNDPEKLRLITSDPESGVSQCPFGHLQETAFLPLTPFLEAFLCISSIHFRA